MTVSAVKMNAQQFLMLGEDPPGLRLELVHGEIAVSPSPAYEHSYADSQLRAILIEHIRQEGLGELVGDVDTTFDAFNVRRPDIIYLSKARAAKLPEEGHGIPFAPDLCVEILSPGSATMDQTDKMELYAKSGVPFYWIVDPSRRTFTAYKLVKKRYVETAAGVNDEEVVAMPFGKLKVPLGRLWAPKRRGRG